MIHEKAKEMNVQLETARTATPDEARWLRVKEYVRGLPSDFRIVLNRALSEPGTPRLKKYRRNHVWDIDISARQEGLEIILNIGETFTGEIVRAMYFSFNRDKNVCFTRDLLKEDPLNQF